MMQSRPTESRTAAFQLVAYTLVGLGLATAVIMVLVWQRLGVGDASLVYIVPVVVVATRFGTRSGAVASILAFLIYDFLFTFPRFSFVVQDPHQLLDLVLFLFVALVVGRLSALGLERARLAELRAAESQAQFAVSRHLATRDLEEAIPAILARLITDVGLSRVWVTMESGAGSRVIADSAVGEPLPGSGIVDVLIRRPGDEPARWVRAHAPTDGPRLAPGALRLRVRIEAEGDTTGSLWSVSEGGLPGREQTRLLALTADQLGIALRRDDLRRAAMDAEISHRSDLLKSSLVTSVSHDLRTPLAGIRAAAGGLLDPATTPDRDAIVRAAAEIDAAATRLDRMVRGLLDLGRIESGLLRPDLEAFDLRSIVEAAVDRMRPVLERRSIMIDISDDAPPVWVDGLLFDEILGNLLENIARHTSTDAPCRITAAETEDRHLDLVVEDGGPGVTGPGLERLFTSFTRAGEGRPDRGGGTGIGLAVVRGFATAMGVEISASRSALGGLAVALRLPTVAMPSAEPGFTSAGTDQTTGTGPLEPWVPEPS